MHLLPHWLISGHVYPTFSTSSPSQRLCQSLAFWLFATGGSGNHFKSKSWSCKARWVEKEWRTLFSNRQWLTHCQKCTKPAHLSRFMLIWTTVLTNLCYSCWSMYHLLRTWLRNVTKKILSNTLFHHWNSAHFTGTYFNLHLNFGFIEW